MCQKRLNSFNVILRIPRSQTLLHRCPNQWSRNQKYGYHCISIPIVALLFQALEELDNKATA